MSTENRFGFYYDNEPVSKEKFIENYSEEYFDSSQKQTVKKIGRSSYFSENEITRLLNKDELFVDFKMNLIKIMAWKLGGIDKDESEKQKCFKMNEGWENPLVKDIKRGNWRPINGQALNNFLDKIATDEFFKAERSWEAVYQKLIEIYNECKVENFGVTYLLTLLYFLTEGKCPIYDKYAQMALFAIKNDINPFKGNKKPPVEYSIPGINCVPCNYGIYYTYMEDLKEVFNYDQIDDKEYLRKIDQALWVYGHLFAYDN